MQQKATVLTPDALFFKAHLKHILWLSRLSPLETETQLKHLNSVWGHLFCIYSMYAPEILDYSPFE